MPGLKTHCIWTKMASHEAVVSTFETVLTNLERVSDCFHTVQWYRIQFLCLFNKSIPLIMILDIVVTGAFKFGGLNIFWSSSQADTEQNSFEHALYT